MINLILKAKQGDKEAMEKILKEFEPLVYKTSISYYIYGYESEDIRQIARLTIIKAIDKFNVDLSNSFPAYVQKSIKNQMNKEIEKASKRYYENKLNNSIANSIQIKEIIDEDINISEDYIKKELNNNLFKAIEQLNSEEKALLNSIYVEGNTLKAYAENLKLEYYKVRYMRDKVMEKLKQQLVIND